MIPREGNNIAFFTSALTAADTAASATNFKAYYHANIRLYMEACLITNKMKMASPTKRRPRLLVTEDFKFFKYLYAFGADLELILPELKFVASLCSPVGGLMRLSAA